MKAKGDTGAYLRKTMGAMVLFGVPPEEYWPYREDEKEFDQEPPAFCYAFAQNYQIKYFNLHPEQGLRGSQNKDLSCKAIQPCWLPLQFY
jgi:hypothetical protein